jgi:hypothetical protein
MDPCIPASMCQPPSIAWSALILWTITLYGVLAILSVFVAVVQHVEATGAGARIARLFFFADLASAAAAPLLIYGVLGAPTLAFIATGVQIAMAIVARAAARRLPGPELPRARALR